MKKIIGILLLLVISIPGFSAGVPSPQTPAPLVDALGHQMSDTYPAPIKVIGTPSIILSSDTIGLKSAVASVVTQLISGVTISTDSTKISQAVASVTNQLISGVAIATMPSTLGSVTVIIPSVSSQTVVLLSGTDYVIPAISNRKYIALWATGTFETGYGVATVPANTPPCYSFAKEAGSAILISVKTTATATYLGVVQDGN